MLHSQIAASPVALAFIAAFFFGLAIVIAQQGLRTIGTLTGATVANVAAAVLFWAAAPFFWDSAGATTLAVAVFVLVGLFFPATVTLLMLEGNRQLGPAMTAAISGTTPLFAFFGAVLFLGEAFVALGLIGTGAIVAGVAVLVWRGNSAHQRFVAWLIVLPFGAALIRAVAHVLTKYGLTLWPNAFAAILIAYTASAFLTCALLAMRKEASPRVPALGWFVLSGISNGIAVLAMFAAFRDGDVTVVAPIVATAPLVTLSVSVFITHGERISPRLVIGMLTTLCGVVLILLR